MKSYPLVMSEPCLLYTSKLGFTNEEMIAFGDNYNDITMIGYAGLGVAMGNAEAVSYTHLDVYKRQALQVPAR